MPFPPQSVGLPTAHVATQASQDQHSQIQEVSFLFLGVLEFWYAFKHVQQQYIYLSIWLLSIHVTTNQASQPQLSRHNINTLKTQRQHSQDTTQHQHQHSKEMIQYNTDISDEIVSFGSSFSWVVVFNSYLNISHVNIKETLYQNTNIKDIWYCVICLVFGVFSY